MAVTLREVVLERSGGKDKGLPGIGQRKNVVRLKRKACDKSLEEQL